jgi:glutathione peroxidase
LTAAAGRRDDGADRTVRSAGGEAVFDPVGPPLFVPSGERSPPVDLHDIPVRTLSGRETTLKEFAGTSLLIVNVASRCGATPQYAGLEKLHEQYAEQGFAVLGFPCNQFGGQEPGTPEQIRDFCSSTYGVTFPLFEKVEVNGRDRHPLYAELTRAADPDGKAGAVRWNFEKFLVSPDGDVLARFRTSTEPDAAELVGAVEASLPQVTA